MYKILSKKKLNNAVTQMEILAPLVAKKAKAGQFIILRVDKDGERIPLTVAGYDREIGSVKIIFQVVGATTMLLNQKEAGDFIEDFVGPLGKATEVKNKKRVIVVGGGVGTAIALPVAEALKKEGAEVLSIVGFRNSELVILEDEFKACSDKYILCTDDGSLGLKGNVTMPLKEILSKDKNFDEIIAIGPIIMMKFTTLTAKEFGVPVVVSMNPIMIDGTGMCGGCRLNLIEDGKKVTKFACVDGPEFDGYKVDFDSAMKRGAMYKNFERHAYENACNLLNKKEV